MKVLHLIPFLWSGAGDVVTRLAVSQSARHDVRVVTSGASRGMRDWPAYRRRLRAAGIDVHQIDLFDRQPDVFWPSCRAVAGLVAAWQPHVLHAHAGVPTCAALLAAGGRPVVSQFYNWGPDRPAWMNDMDLAGLRGADAVVVSATHYRTWLASHGVADERLHLVPWGLDAAWLDEPTPAPGRRGPRLGFVGRVEPRKDQRALVGALALIRRTLPHAHLDLVGPTADPGYAAALKRDISRLGLEAHVRLRGHVRDVRAAMRGWDVFVSLSRDEGQGLAVLEAMASRVPVVARLVPGVEDVIVDGRTGVAVVEPTAEAAAAAILEALAPGTRDRIVRGARALVTGRYRWERTVQALATVYRRAARARQSR